MQARGLRAGRELRGELAVARPMEVLCVRVIGLDIGGTKCAVIHSDGEEVSQLASIATADPESTLRQLFSVIDDLQPGPEVVFGVSCGGPLDSKAGLILSPPNLPGWDKVHITGLLQQRYGCRAYLMNDANAGALAEWRFGAARGQSNAVFLTFGTGMGAGLILDGRLYEGTCDLAGEVGHIRLAEDGPLGYGKPGSFEGFCSGGGIARLVEQEASSEEKNEIRKAAASTDERITAKDVGEAARLGSPAARRILEKSGYYLGRGLAVILDMLNPQVIVIGSIYRRCRAFLEPAMRRALEQEALAPSREACKIVPAGLGEEIGDYAAVSVALYREGLL